MPGDETEKMRGSLDLEKAVTSWRRWRRSGDSEFAVDFVATPWRSQLCPGGKGGFLTLQTLP
jgi:hypothetical protein